MQALEYTQRYFEAIEEICDDEQLYEFFHYWNFTLMHPKEVDEIETEAEALENIERIKNVLEQLENYEPNEVCTYELSPMLQFFHRYYDWEIMRSTADWLQDYEFITMTIDECKERIDQKDIAEIDDDTWFFIRIVNIETLREVARDYFRIIERKLSF